MSYGQLHASVAAEASQQERAVFIQKTYNHVSGAVFALTAVLYLLHHAPFRNDIIGMMWGGRFNGLITILAFWGVTNFAISLAQSVSKSQQYLALGLYVVAEALLLLPLVSYASRIEGVLSAAIVITLALFVALTFIAFTSGKDFSFLRGFVTLGCFIIFGLIIAGFLFGFTLGPIVSAFAILLMGCSILYQTSDVMYRYHTSQYVPAALGLFAALATMFFYILNLLLSLSGGD